jgi:hypothetical protein
MILMGIELYHALKTKNIQAYLKSMAYIGVATLLALAVNASSLWSTYDYGTETIRGKSNLTQTAKEPSTGLDKDYAYQWSQGVGESLTFLIPNAYGGGSGTEVLDQNSETAKVLIAKGVPEDQAVSYTRQITASVPGMTTYWGNKPGTAGPYYFGAVVCFLFLFGLLIIKNRIKWWLLTTVILTLFLSFGKNLPFLSDIFFNYFPLYNKFRAVESVLAVASICFPILGFLAVQEIIEAKDRTFILKKLMLSLYILGGLALLFVVVPDLILSFRAEDQSTGISYLTQAFQNNAAMANDIAAAIVKDRISLARMDAIRSLIFVLLTFGVVWAFIKQKLNVLTLSTVLLALTLIDMWQIDRRYLKNENFQDKIEAAQAVKPREVDQYILKDTDPDYRVFDATADFRSDSFNPFFHKSITGYSAARLKRYEELYLSQFTKNVNHDVLDMLNTKYIISADPKNQNLKVQANSSACGNVWFVKSIRYAENADQEMQAISNFSPKDEVIVDKQYKFAIDGKTLGSDLSGKITLTHYSPDHMTYESSSSSPQIAVFSEIYYNKGWKMLIDGVEKPYFRADYLLRAAHIAIGKHKIEFIFHPTSYYTGENISLVASVLLIFVICIAIYVEIKRESTQKKTLATRI